MTMRHWPGAPAGLAEGMAVGSASASAGGGAGGGAGAGGRVAADLATLGASVRVVSIVGADEAGAQVKKMLGEWSCDLSGVVEVAGRPSTSKVRLVGLAQHRHPQQMLRLDYEDASPIAGE